MNYSCLDSHVEVSLEAKHGWYRKCTPLPIPFSSISMVWNAPLFNLPEKCRKVCTVCSIRGRTQIVASLASKMKHLVAALK